MKRSSPGLRVRLLQLVLFAVLPAFGVIGYSAFVEHERAAERAKADALKLVQLAAREHSRLIEQTRQVLVSLTRVPAVQTQQSLADCRRALVETQIMHPLYTNIGVARLNGDVVCNSRQLRQPINITDRGYFQRALHTQDFAIGDYQIGRVTGEPAINFGYPVFDPDGKLRAVIYAALNLRWLEQLIADVERPPGSVIFVTDNKGSILAHIPESDIRFGESRPGESIISTVLATPKGGTVEMNGLDGVPRLHAFAPLHEGADSSVHIVVGISRAAAFADADRQFELNLSLLLVAAVLAIVLAWIGGRVLILRRMNILADAARRLGEGDLSARTGLSHGEDEFGRLARSFDDMASALHRVHRALKTLSAGNRAMVRATVEQTLLNDMCRVIVQIGCYKFAWIGYAEHDENKTVRPVAECGFDGGLAAVTTMLGPINWADNEHGRGAVGTAIRTSKASVQRDFPHNPNLAAWREEAIRHRFSSVVAFPLIVDGRPIGTLAIYASEVDAFDVDEIEVLDEFTNDLAFGIAGLRTRVESERAQATIKHMAYHDRLTGLPNHAQLQEQLRKALPQAGMRGESIALVMLGLNRLREINDALGFHQGDLLLKDVGTRMRAAVAEEILVARMRGDEFALLISNNDDVHVASITYRVLSSLRVPFIVGELSLDVTAAAGIAMFPRHGADTMHLMRCADVAMQQAKKTNKDYVFYAAEHDANSARRLTLAGELRHAIENGELMLHYQPKIDIAGGHVSGAEALVRWAHPTRGMIPPDEFIMLAEQTGLIRPLSDWVMTEALRQSVAWRQVGLALPIAVNLSPRNLHDTALIYKIDQLFAAARADANWLEIEITEGAVMEDPEGALKILARLGGMGIQLFIDDFGTGYSSLGYLKKLPVDAVKIDKSFVMDMLNSQDSAAIVRSTIDLAHDLDLKVVAEGVETQAVLEKLSHLGCDVAQGYYFSKPLSAEKFRDWMETRSRD